MSRLTPHQLRSQIERMQATQERAPSRARAEKIERYRAELAAREAPEPPEAHGVTIVEKPKAPELPPLRTEAPPDDAVYDAAAVIRTHGPAVAIRAFYAAIKAHYQSAPWHHALSEYSDMQASARLREIGGVQ